MTTFKTRIRIGPGGELSGRVEGGSVGEHDAEIILLDQAGAAPRASAHELLARVRAIQSEISDLPVLDQRSPDEILGYNERGHFD